MTTNLTKGVSRLLVSLSPNWYKTILSINHKSVLNV